MITDRNSLVIEVINNKIKKTNIGLVVQGLVDIDPAYISTIVADKIQSELYVAIIGYNISSYNERIVLADSIEKAVDWRSKPDCAGKIIVFVQGEVAKLHSLGDLDFITSRDLALELVDIAAKDLSENIPWQKFWKAMKDESSTFPLKMVEEFTRSVYEVKNDLNAVPKNLWRLGLLKDDLILDSKENAIERLNKNRQLLIAIGQLSEESRKRIGRVLLKSEGTNKDRLKAAFKIVQEFYRRGGTEPLQKLDLSVVEELIKAGKPIKNPNPDPTPPPSGVEQDPPPTDHPLKGKELEKQIDEYFVSGSKETENILRDLGELLKDSVLADGDNNEPFLTTCTGFSDRTLLIDKPNKEIQKFIGHTCTIDNWGGLVTTPFKQLKEAILQFKIEEFNAYNPSNPSNGVLGRAVFDLLEEFDKYLDGDESFYAIINRLIRAREKLISSMDLLLNYPFILFGGFIEARNTLRDYIDAYSDLFRLFCRKESILHSQDPVATNFIASELLRLEVIYVRTPIEWKAILTPLHPFHLWRFYEIIKTIHSGDKPMSEDEQKQLYDALPNMPHLLHYLVASSDVTSGEEVTLPQSGSIGNLPTYENKTNRYLGNDGIDFVRELLDRWISYSPYSKNEIRIATLDIPSISGCLKHITEFLSESSCNRVVFDAYFTRGQNASGELARLDYDNKDHDLSELIRLGKILIRINNYNTIDKVIESLQKRPVHIAYLFDQSQYQVGFGIGNKQLYVSPLVVSYDYEFSEAFHRGTISPTSDVETGIFGDYNFMVKLAAHMPSNQHIKMRFDTSVDLGPINNLLEEGSTQWLAIADRVTNTYSPVSAIPLGEQRCGQREVSVWSSSKSRVIKQYMELLIKYNLSPNEQVLAEILHEYGHITASGLINLPKNNNSQVVERRRKGLIGTILAAAWYSKHYPGALVASLDSNLARQWLQCRAFSDERADLIGLRINDSGDLIIEPIEVKTHEEGAEVHEVEDKLLGHRILAGRAVDQVESMLQILRAIFGGDDDQPFFTPARREVLKYQLHTECFREIHEVEWQKKWYLKLKESFTTPAPVINVHLHGLIIHVQLEQNGEEEIKEYASQQIILVKLRTNTIQRILNPNKDTSIDYSIKEFNNIISTASNTEHCIQEKVEHKLLNDEEAMITVAEVVPGTSDGNEKSQQINEEKQKKSSTVTESKIIKMELDDLARSFRRACQSYRINVDECNPEKAIVGPSVIRFYVKLTRGQGLEPLRSSLEDIGREMSKSGLLLTNIPNSNEITLDIPKTFREILPISRALQNLPQITSSEQLPFPIGVTPEGKDLISDLGQIYHLLVGGSTGSGKTIFLQTMLSALLTTHPDPKMLKLFISSSGLEDFVYFKDLPHLINGDIVTDPAKAVELIQGIIAKEFDERARLLAEARCPNIIEYNAKSDVPLPPLVVVVDEFADLADQLGKKKDDFYTNLRRIAQIGRKRGIHLVLCTQRPSANLVPTDMRSQMNGRLALRVNDVQSSRMILEDGGAQHLQKHGDLLFKEQNTTIRAQGYYVSSEELDTLISKLKKR
jgi:hypothetical protein